MTRVAARQVAMEIDVPATPRTRLERALASAVAGSSRRTRGSPS
jgi:hypothetical protein